MKALFSKKVIAAAATATAMFAGASAHAAPVYQDFQVKRPGTQTTFTADRITGDYVEVASFNPTSASGGTFQVSLRWTATGFVANSEATRPTTLQSRTTGLGNDYGLYALYTASGTFGLNAAGDTEFNFTPNTGSLAVYMDMFADDLETEFNTPGAGNVPFTTVGTTGDDDVLLATGRPLRGNGLLDPDGQSCGDDGINCGSFGSTTTFALQSPAGTNFFVSPANPFYNLSLQSGNLNDFDPFQTGPQTITGLLNVTFENRADVPEPASLGLLGLGLLGLSAARRRKQAK